MRKSIGIVIVIFWVMIAGIAHGSQTIRVGWDRSNSTAIEGYKVYYGPESRDYSTSVDAGNVTETELELQEGREYYLTCAGYIGTARTSYSNEVRYYNSGEITSQNGYQGSPELIVKDYGTIKGNVDSLPSNPKSVYWQKNNLDLRKGEKVDLDMEIYCSNGEITPISVYVKDAETGEWITPERVVYVDYNLTSNVELTAEQECSNATLKVVCGHKTGSYEFSNIEIESYTGPFESLREFDLYELVTPITEGRYAAHWKWNEIPEADEFIVRVAQSRQAIENPTHYSLSKTTCLAGDKTGFTLDITEDLLNGLFVSVTPVIDGEEETPIIYPYLPGNILGTADDPNPPLYNQISVDSDDYRNAYYAYFFGLTVPTPEGPACTVERTDFNNNMVVDRDDFKLVKYLLGNSLE